MANPLERAPCVTDADGAIRWIARLRSHNVSDAQRICFTEWLGEDIAHRLAFDEVMRVWERAGVATHLHVERRASPVRLRRD